MDCPEAVEQKPFSHLTYTIKKNYSKAPRSHKTSHCSIGCFKVWCATLTQRFCERPKLHPVEFFFYELTWKFSNKIAKRYHIFTLNSASLISLLFHQNLFQLVKHYQMNHSFCTFCAQS